jgi:hypothetical protein
LDVSSRHDKRASLRDELPLLASRSFPLQFLMSTSTRFRASSHCIFLTASTPQSRGIFVSLGQKVRRRCFGQLL